MKVHFCREFWLLQQW